jgi:flagellar basal body-associated protein FliL
MKTYQIAVIVIFALAMFVSFFISKNKNQKNKPPTQAEIAAAAQEQVILNQIAALENQLANTSTEQLKAQIAALKASIGL